MVDSLYVKWSDIKLAYFGFYTFFFVTGRQSRVFLKQEENPIIPVGKLVL